MIDEKNSYVVISLSIALLVLIILGGILFYWLYSQNINLKSKITELSKPIPSKDNSSYPELRVAFAPDTFTQQEREDLINKIIAPYNDFNLDIAYPESQPYAFLIEKNGDSGTDGEYLKDGYLYNISVLQNNQTVSGWEQQKVTDYWIPDCMSECSFTENFKAKHPEVVKKYEDTLKEINNN